MTLYEELAAAASKAVQVADKFYAEATVFPACFGQKLANYLGTSGDQLELLHWRWASLEVAFSPGNTTDLRRCCPDLHFTFAVSITPVLSAPLQKLIITPAFSFKPIHDGIEIVILNRQPDRSLKETDRFIIRSDDDWQPLFECCTEFWRNMLSFNPYDAQGARIGFDISPSPSRELFPT